MSSSSVRNIADSSAITGEGNTRVQFGNRSPVGSLIAREGATINTTNTTTDLGAVTGALSMSGDLTKQLLGTVGQWVGGATSLAAAGLKSADSAQAGIGSGIAAAYRDARGTLNTNTLAIVVAAVVVAAIAGYVMVKK